MQRPTGKANCSLRRLSIDAIGNANPHPGKRVRNPTDAEKPTGTDNRRTCANGTEGCTMTVRKAPSSTPRLYSSLTRPGRSGEMQTAYSTVPREAWAHRHHGSVATFSPSQELRLSAIAPRGSDKADSDDVEELVAARASLSEGALAALSPDLRLLQMRVRHGHFKANPRDRAEGPKPPPLHPRNPPGAGPRTLLPRRRLGTAKADLRCSCRSPACAAAVASRPEPRGSSGEIPRAAPHFDVRYGKAASSRAVALAEETSPFSRGILPRVAPPFPNRFGNAVQADTDEQAHPATSPRAGCPT